MTQNYSLPYTVNPPQFNGFSNNFVSTTDIKTYGAIVLPFNVDDVLKKSTVQNNPKTLNDFKGKLKSALKNAPSNIKNAITHPSQTFKNLAQYMKDNRNEISGLMNTIGSKFSGIAVTQALINGKVTSKEALDYLFMGFAPALGVQGSLMGYSGLNQMKEALFDGSINVGAFVSGFTRTLKGATDLKDMLAKKQTQVAPNVIEIDLTLSHNETMQSETPDRRVQSQQTLNEFVHNLPDTFDVQCALQEGKRYSKAEFRAIIQYLRQRKETVQLVLGGEVFDSLILTNFNPSHDCTKSGMDYTLSFKKIHRSDIQNNVEVNIVQIDRKKLEMVMESGTGSLNGSGSGDVNVSVGDLSKQLTNDIASIMKPLTVTSLPKIIDNETGGHIGSTLRRDAVR